MHEVTAEREKGGLGTADMARQHRTPLPILGGHELSADGCLWDCSAHQGNIITVTTKYAERKAANDYE